MKPWKTRVHAVPLRLEDRGEEGVRPDAGPEGQGGAAVEVLPRLLERIRVAQRENRSPERPAPDVMWALATGSHR